MARVRLFFPDLALGRHALSKEESHHAVHVLRLRVGDEVSLFDGVGGVGRGAILSVGREQVRVEISDVVRHQRPENVALTLAVAPPRSHRQGYMIEKCTELGLDAFWPIICQRGVAKPSPSTVDKWSRRAVQALKQCRGTWLPKIQPPQDFLTTLARIKDFDLALIARPGPKSLPLVGILGARFDTGAPARGGSSLAAGDRSHRPSLLVWIGPEGGWSEAELEAADAAGARPTHLGGNVLRTETAAIAVTAIVNAHFAVASPLVGDEQQRHPWSATNSSVTPRG